MILLSAQGVEKSHGAKCLFRDVALGVDAGDRLAVIGVNGSGKSTLLRILAGRDTPDQGTVVLRQDIRVEYLSQNPEFPSGLTVSEYLFASDKPEAALIRDYEEVCLALETTPDDEGLLRRFDDLTARMNAAAAWDYEAQARRVLTRLHIHDLQAPLASLSGGYRRRLALAHALLAEPDLLFLDEPTNHLDADTIAWLEEWLERFSGAVILVTHDRYFLDRVTDRILEIEGQTIRDYPGAYSAYLQRKADEEVQAVRQEERRQSILRKELAWLERGCKARSTKQKARIERAEQLEAAAPAAPRQSLRFAVRSRRLGGKVIDVQDLTYQWDDEALIQGFSHAFTRGERMGILGPNGCGKTTLAQLIAGRLAPRTGSIERGETVHFGYFDQECAAMDPAEKALDFVTRQGGDMLRSPDGAILTAAMVLEKFYFTPQMLYNPIEKLSGGERRRLYLVSVLMGDPNFLILDEPTNDLDIQTLQALEDFLDGYDGCLLVVSHDRYFLDRTVDRLLAFEPDGTLRLYPGSYAICARLRAEYHQQIEEAGAAAEARNGRSVRRDATPVAGGTDAEGTAGGDGASARPRKLTFNEARELRLLEEGIPAMEEELDEVNRRMGEAANDYGRLMELEARRRDLEQRLEAGMARWEHLATQAEKAR